MRPQLILLGLLCLMPFGALAKSYGSGGGSHSYSSKSSSYSSSSHGSYSSSFSSSRKSSAFGSSLGSSLGSSFSSSGKTYSSGLNKKSAGDESHTGTHAADSGKTDLQPAGSSTASSGGSSKFFSPPQRKTSSFDSAAADAQQHQESKKAYTTWKTANTGNSPKTGTYSGTYGGTAGGSGGNAGGTYGAQRDNYDYRPPPLHHSYASPSSTPFYVPTHTVLVTRPVRLRQTYYSYYDRPQVIYNDPYSSLFWWWLLDQSIDSRAQWAYNHRYTMDPLRYQLLMNDADLANRVQALEAQQSARNPNFTPYGLDQDLMYNDAYAQNPAAVSASPPGTVSSPSMLRSPNLRSPSHSGRILFWVLLIPAAGCVGAFVIWGVFFKRWA